MIGIAATEELDALLTKDDFEPATDIDIDLLETVDDLLKGAEALTKRLQALRTAIDTAKADEVDGLKVEVALTVERIAARVAVRIG